MARPIRTTGALLINPRKRRKGARRAKSIKVRLFPAIKTNSRRKRKPGRRRRNGLYLRANPRLNRRPRRLRRRRNGVYFRGSRKANPRRSSRSRVRIYAKTGRKRRNGLYLRKRRNIGALNKLQQLPLIGGLFGFLPASLFGAVSTEPTMMVASIGAGFFPAAPASLLYAASGLVSGALLSFFLPKLGFSRATAHSLATAAASAAGGIAWYKWRTGQDSDAGSEMAGLSQLGYAPPLAGFLPQASFGDVGPEVVVPFGYRAVR